MGKRQVLERAAIEITAAHAPAEECAGVRERVVSGTGGESVDDVHHGLRVNAIQRFRSERKMLAKRAFCFVRARGLVVLLHVLRDVFVERVRASNASEGAAELLLGEELARLLPRLGECDLRKAAERASVPAQDQNKGFRSALRDANAKAGNAVVPIVALALVRGLKAANGDVGEAHLRQCLDSNRIGVGAVCRVGPGDE